nr:sigma-70 family RNA polymerase sigma factor [uncultured Merdimonas sp.]
MNYTEAVALAKAGEERGYGFLYEMTYKSKYYLALQYVKNEEVAKDVLQESYIRAFTKLDMLTEPEAFPKWLGKIVANTAKNTLVKKNPMLFPDMGTKEEEENFEYRIEDDRVESQPELSYTRQETQELVRQLIDSLSEEQRMCILMFHIEGVPISEIASTLGCSENTVKSRLNYGRKNLKKKAEELQKKGYKLYSVAPLPLFLYLLRTQEGYLLADGSLSAVGKSVAGPIFRELVQKGITGAKAQAVSKTPTAAKTQTAAKTSGAAAKAGAKAGVLHTTLGKVAVVAVGLCLAGGAGYFAASQILGPQEEPAVQEQKQPEASEKQEEEEKPAQETPAEVRDEDYPELIAGNLTKQELEYVFAYGPQEIPEQGFSEEEIREILNAFCDASSRSGDIIESYGPDENWRPRYSASDVNRLFASFSDYQFTEENDEDGAEYGINIDGDVLTFVPATINYVCEAEITSAQYTEEMMEVSYNYECRRESGQESVQKKAVLRPDQDGLYKVVSIEVTGAGDQAGQEEQAQQAPGFPAGSYSYVAPAGGLRAGLTIDEAGNAEITEMMSGTGKTYKSTYQMSVDSSASGNGVITYVLTSLDGGAERSFTYNEAQQTLYDVTGGFAWTKVE